MTDTALVIGGSGFLGSHLCDRLIDEGARVVCLDNFLTGAYDNIRHLIDHRAFRLVEHDIREPYAADEPLAFVFHLASPASPPAYMRYPIETLEVGSIGTKNALEIARRAEARFLFTSTSEVYGDPEVSPQPESYRGNVSTTGPRSVYDEAKRYGEALVTAYRRSYGLETRIVRIFNTYGPRLHPNDGRAVSNFITQALRNEPITVYGDGSQTRSFCYVSDQVEGIVAVARGGYAEPINIGNPDERTILEIAEIIRDKTKTSSDIRFEALPEDDPLQRRPDVSLARRVLGWEPRVSFDEGIDETLRWFADRDLEETKVG
ncbi:MAG TPA: UDP-glucuronic acid decarboxylase family protein [Actinomycetota bacterium]|nr:UDP-glucuronic acid decarboxylase family protein [Actinomycetota bacterium]